MLVIAHVSDTHFGNEAQDPASRNAAVMDHLLAMSPRPDLLVVTGDVADHGLPEEYAEARAWLDRWDGPLAVCPGNHDVRDAFVAGLGIGTRTVVEVAGVRFVMLDSLVDADETGRVDPGRLGDDQLGLARRPSRRGRAADVRLSPPPAHHDRPRPDGPDPAARRGGARGGPRPAPHVVATLVGHAHTMCATTFAGRPLLIGGGVVSTVTADAEAPPTIWYDAPPSFALHLVGDDGRVTTHWRALPA